MKDILGKIFGSAGGGIADKISSVVDKFVQTKDEKAEFEKEMTNIFMAHELSLEKEITSRHSADMQSDSWLSKNTRPLALIFLTVSMMLLIFIDSTGLDFSVDSGWVDLLKSLLITVYVAYFGSRGAEKFKSISK